MICSSSGIGLDDLKVYHVLQGRITVNSDSVVRLAGNVSGRGRLDTPSELKQKLKKTWRALKKLVEAKIGR